MSRTLQGITYNLQAWMLYRATPTHGYMHWSFMAATWLCCLIDRGAIHLKIGRWIYLYQFREFPYDPSFTPKWSVRVKKWVQHRPYLTLVHQHKVLVFLSDVPIVVQAHYRMRENSNKLIGKVTPNYATKDQPIQTGTWVHFTTANCHPTSL